VSWHIFGVKMKGLFRGFCGWLLRVRYGCGTAGHDSEARGHVRLDVVIRGGSGSRATRLI
jgi:hypothetical protein